MRPIVLYVLDNVAGVLSIAVTAARRMPVFITVWFWARAGPAENRSDIHENTCLKPGYGLIRVSGVVRTERTHSLDSRRIINGLYVDRTMNHLRHPSRDFNNTTTGHLRPTTHHQLTRPL